MTIEGGSTSTWHAIRPWMPPSLTLTTREITSVSATFVLSTCDWNSQIKSLSETFLVSSKSAEDEDGSDEEENRAPIAETLSKGLSVKVNSSPWQRVLIRVDERADEAVVIVYGLLPGRGYEIELGVIHDVPGAGLEGLGEEVHTHEERVRRDVVTEGTEHIHADGTDDTQSSSDFFSPSDPPSPSSSLNSVSPPPRPTITIEQYTNTLLARLTALNNERSELIATLKATRKESQKADSTLRSEIDILKRSSERFVKEEARAKQKLLALQEAEKRSRSATEEIEEQAKEVQSDLPELEAERTNKEKEFERVKAEADKVRARREEVEADARKRDEGLKAELGREEARLEKLGARRERLEGGVAELEDKLEEVRREIDRVEREEYPLDEDVEQSDPAVGERGNSAGHESNIAPGQPTQLQKKRHPHFLHPRNNFFGGRGYQHHSAGPIQRPHQQSTSPFHNHFHHHHHQNHSPFGGGYHHNRNGVPTGPKGPTRISGNAAGSSSSGSSGSSPHIPSAAASLSTGGATAPITILSSRAPPFEPSSGRYANRSSTFPAPSASDASRGHNQTQSLSQFTSSTSELNPASAPFTPRMAHLARAANAADPAAQRGGNSSVVGCMHELDR
ncbi:hypothetical protein GLOTRDRAFT_111733 [Gloeophyllum trabeum ATCC 11539]|uniref:Uncharacterized protein n=1 Tax=Gloeophyllum trabeum (strain ATCC 11539 / FP-39264 / Madison 617) TaxID=670483 RepID=S7Q263_GLOTA|nr:uncharacterized protein GLOTRDRAFT_111733 [Gloeophyllum trabeum ATCC 11539]EPQ53658.1 hypothetical protein GLOTRDRAFT_111733 [Gloeophyllum trabeum ATCC 11539]